MTGWYPDDYRDEFDKMLEEAEGYTPSFVPPVMPGGRYVEKLVIPVEVATNYEVCTDLPAVASIRGRAWAVVQTYGRAEFTTGQVADALCLTTKQITYALGDLARKYGLLELCDHKDAHQWCWRIKT